MKNHPIFLSDNNKNSNGIINDTCNEIPNEVILHEDIVDILFKHKEEIHRKLIDIKGIFLLDHIAIKIIDPNNKLLIFSITPSVEYNLIVQNLWRHDNSFSPHSQKNNHFYSWENAYRKKYASQIKQIKELKHGFTFGFNITKKLDKFTLIYSCATRSKSENLLEYYQSYLDELIKLGDYGYKLIHSIYLNYCNPYFTAPTIIQSQSCHKKSILKLIVNNK